MAVIRQFKNNEWIDLNLTSTVDTDSSVIYVSPSEPSDLTALWIDTDDTSNDVILATVAETGNYNDLINKPTMVSSIGGKSGTISTFTTTEANNLNLASVENVNAKQNLPTKNTANATSFTIADNTIYTHTGKTTITITNNSSASAMGFVTFSGAGTITCSGFTDISGDIVSATPASGETWEWNAYNGYIIWKNWGQTGIDV